MDLVLTAVYEEIPASEGGGYIAYVEELPGANTQGESLNEARENLKDAIKELLEARRALLGEAASGHKITREKIAVPIS
jgi:predicted RNase H-like HicB family nuclease